MDPQEEAAFRALVEQAKRICVRNPSLLPAYIAAVQEKGKGMSGEALRTLLDEVSAGVPKLP